MRIELRCPGSFRKLLGDVQSAGQVVIADKDNLIGLACRDCKDAYAEATGSRPAAVIHYFSLDGSVVRTEAKWKDDRPR